MKDFQLVLLIFSVSPAWLFAQLPSSLSNKDSIAAHAPDTSKRNFRRAVSELILSNLIPWSYDKYIKQKNSADITFQSIRHNLNPGNWGWDEGNFSVNQLAHPFHGSTYFNAYRANGYRFWQSVPAPFLGSYIWETAAESLHYSVNDFVNTSYGGVVIGEMTHKLANRILNKRSSGIKKQVNEIFALVINPVNGLNRLLDGKWGKPLSGTALQDTTRLFTELGVGIRRIRADSKDIHFRWYGHIKLSYGTPIGDLNRPFNYFNVDAEFGRAPSDILNQLSICGSLSGWKIGFGAKDKHSAMLTANYDYINNDFFSYSAQSIRFNLLSESIISNALKLHNTITAGPVLLAAVSDPQKGRSYSYCSGAGFSINGQISYKNRLFCGINYRSNLFKTLNGNSSHHFLHSLSSEIRYRYTNGFYICAEPGYLILKGKYKHYGGISNSFPYLHLSVRYAINY